MLPISQSVRHGYRFLRSLTFSVPAVAILALGLGANVAIFAVAYAVLLRPLPFTDQDALVIMWERDERRNQPLWEVSYRNFVDWRAQSRSFTGLAAIGSVNWSLNMVQKDGTVVLSLAAVSASFFDVLGTRPALGRGFVATDDERLSPAVAILSDETWRTQFGADPHAVGRSVTMVSKSGSSPFTIVGVMPHEFDFPRGAAAWMPLGRVLADVSRDEGFDALEERDFGILYVVGRLAPGVDSAAARAEMDGIVGRLTASADARDGRSAVLTPLTEHIFGQTRPALLLLLGAALLVLALTCVNVVGLLLARLSAQRRQFAVQIALGAERSHLMQQSVAEAAALVVCGVLLAAALAYWSVPLLVTLAPADVPRLADVTLQRPGLLAFTFGLATIVALVCGTCPLLLLRRPDMNLLRPASMAPTSTLGVRNTLAAAQMAAAVVLLVAATLTVRSFHRIERLDLGFDPSDVITFDVAAPSDKYPKAEANVRFYRPVLERIRALPGVGAVGAVYLRPFEHGPIGSDVAIVLEGQSPRDPEAWSKNPSLNSEAITPDYFRVMGIRLLDGRVFTDHDSAEASAVVIVSLSTARRLWPGKNPIGQRLLPSYDSPGKGWQTVVGVVADARYRGLNEARFDLYKPYLQSQDSVKHFVVKPSGRPPAFDRLRQEVLSVDPGAVVDDIRPMSDIVGRQTAPWRFTAVLFSLLAGLALSIAVIGLYGLFAYQVTERTREIGIRIALGARRSQIAGFMVRRGLPAVLGGLTSGLILALLSAGAMRSLLFGVEATNAATYAVVCAILLSSAAAGVYWPVRRAASVDPLIALKED